MEQYIRELYCSRIIAGYVRYNKELRIYWPNRDLLYEAAEVYAEAFEEARVEGLLTTSELHSELVVSGLLEPELDAEVKQLNKDLDNLKVQCYKNIDKPKELKSIKGSISRTRYRISNLYADKHKYDHLSAEGVAVFAKWTYILENTVYYKDGRQFKPNDDITVMMLLDFWNVTRLSDEDIRELSRTDPWLSFWFSKQGNMFSHPVADMTEEQRRLLIWSKHYDNIRESPEAPNEDVMQDDDALDGWMIIQRRKRERQQKQEKIEAGIRSDKIRNARDVFIPASNADEALEIDELNDAEARMLKNMRMQRVGRDDLSDMKMRQMKRG